jgi:outer membrane protein assembly factor BamB
MRRRRPFGIDAPWLVVGAIAIFALGLTVVAYAGPDHERYARDRQPDLARPTPILGPGETGARDVASGPAVPPEVAESADDWPLPHRDYANTRATNTAQIDSKNVSTLGVAWYRPLSGASKWGAAATGPLIADGVVYFQDLTSDVYALALDTGAPKWIHYYKQAAFGPNGPAIGYGKLYAHNGERQLAALDLDTGQEVWATPLAGPTGQQQPTVYDGVVYTGIAAGRKARGSGGVIKTRLLAPGSSGFAYGVEAERGGVIWEFQTVEKGFWGDPELNSGAGIWFTPAIDVDSGLTFWSTGNPAPAPGTGLHPNASTRPGPNLYSNTMLALDGKTGNLRWHNQVIPHDIFHHDFQNPPVLATAGGRKLVIGSGKMGVVYAFDRATGELVWKRPIGKHENDELKKLPVEEVVVVYPGFWGGVETPVAYADGVVYALTENLPTPYTATAWNAKDGPTSVENLEGRTRYETGDSELVAIDAATGAVRWTTRFERVAFGGVTVVNDLVFTATYDGVIRALARSDGRVVWSFQAPGGINAWPAVAGDTIVWPVGLGRRPVLLALRLGSNVPITPPKARPTVTTP